MLGDSSEAALVVGAAVSDQVINTKIAVDTTVGGTELLASSGRTKTR